MNKFQWYIGPRQKTSFKPNFHIIFKKTKIKEQRKKENKKKKTKHIKNMPKRRRKGTTMEEKRNILECYGNSNKKK